MSSYTGSVWYAGIPGSGKTTRALRDLVAVAGRTGWPILVVDPARVEQFAAWPRTETVRATLEAVYGRGKHVVFSPRDEEEAEAIFRAIAAAGRTCLLVDEAHYYLSSWYLSPGLSALMRGHRHFLVRLHLTTQSLGDIPQRALGQSPHLYLFRQSSPRTLERIEREYGVPAEEARTVPRFEARYVYDGFDPLEKKELDTGAGKEEDGERKNESRESGAEGGPS